MTNEETTASVSTQDETGKSAAEYIEAIKEIKANSVPRDEFEALEKEKKDLLKALIDGGQIDQPQAAEAPDLNALRAELFNEDAKLNNLEYAKRALKLRAAVLEETGKDIFLPYGANISPSPADVEAAENVAKAFQSCIDYADGDSQLFTQELQRITKKETFRR